VVGFCEHGFAEGPSTAPSTQIAADTPVRLRALAAKPPERVGLLLAAGLLLSGQNRLAWVEAEQCGAGLSSDEVLVARCIRAWAMSNDGMPRLAAEDLEQALASSELKAGLGQEQLGSVHFLLACMHAHERRYAEADREFVIAVQTWPDNPAVVFVTGERLAADGQYEKAAQSLEKSAQGTRQQWLAEILAARAREIRDGKSDARSLIADPKLLLEVTIRGLTESGKDALAATIAKWRDAAAGTAGAAGGDMGVEKR
jgi:tetratricopeptide (TPR) repeat protein